MCLVVLMLGLLLVLLLSLFYLKGDLLLLIGLDKLSRCLMLLSGFRLYKVSICFLGWLSGLER
jgi:hypothetical protein